MFRLAALLLLALTGCAHRPCRCVCASGAPVKEAKTPIILKPHPRIAPSLEAMGTPVYGSRIPWDDNDGVIYFDGAQWYDDHCEDKEEAEE